MKRFSLFYPLGPAIVLLAGLILIMTLTSAQALPDDPDSPNAPGWIEGTLYEPDGTTPVEGGRINVHDAGGQPWMGAESGPTGEFLIPNLPPGMYTLRAHPPTSGTASIYASSLPTDVEVLDGQPTFVDLLLTQVGIGGRVLDCDTGYGIEGAWAVAHDATETFWVWDSTNISGEFKLGGVEVGATYWLAAFPPHESEYVESEFIPVVPISTNVELQLCVPPTSVVGIVKTPTGDPVGGAWTVIWNEFYWGETEADEFGNFAFRGLPPGDFSIQAGPPWIPHSTGLIASEPFVIGVDPPPTTTNVVITLTPAFKTVIGHVVIAGTSDGVPGAGVRAWRLDGPGFAGGLTDPTGAFTMSVTEGEWLLDVEPLEPMTPWIFAGPPAWVVFDPPPEVPEDKAVTLEVIPTNAEVTGHIVCPLGDEPCAPPDAIWVELRNDEIGNGATPDEFYNFAILIPDGWYELVVHVDHPMWQGPEPIPVFVGPGGHYDVGAVSLWLKDALITGRVHDELGIGVPGVPVFGWRPEGFGWGWAETDASGNYTMPVIGGEWFVEPQPIPEQPFVFNQHPQVVRVAPGGMMAGVDFELASADSRIEGMAVDSVSYEPLWGLDGWAWAERLVPPPGEPEFFSDAPMWDAQFELKVRGDEEYWVGLAVPPRAPYVSGGTGPVPVPPAAHVPLEVPLQHKDAVIEGSLIDVTTGFPPAEPVWAAVFGEDEQGHWGGVGVDPHSAWYELAVVSGTWHLHNWVDPASGYVAVPTTTIVTVQSGGLASPVNFPVWPIGSRISGQVLEPDGTTPLPGAFVFAEGESPHVGFFEVYAESGPSGEFELWVPEGGYMVGAALPDAELEMLGWLAPPPIDVPWVAADSPVDGLELRFRRLDGEIEGTVTFAPGIDVTATHPAYVWGWSDSGEWAETEAFTTGLDTFSYTLRVVSGTVWHVGAVYEDWDNGEFYESPEEEVDLTTTGQATQDLELDGPSPLPQPVIVSFDAASMQTIQLLVPPDRYLELVIPAGALADSGTVTLFIFPTHELRPEPGHEIIGAGYEMWAVDQNGQEITQFNENVTMIFPYPSDLELQTMGVSEHMLVPVYFSTLVGHWIMGESYVVDTVNNEILLQINHFTKFGTCFLASETPPVYLPIVLAQ